MNFYHRKFKHYSCSFFFLATSSMVNFQLMSMEKPFENKFLLEYETKEVNDKISNNTSQSLLQKIEKNKELRSKTEKLEKQKLIDEENKKKKEDEEKIKQETRNRLDILKKEYEGFGIKNTFLDKQFSLFLPEEKPINSLLHELRTIICIIREYQDIKKSLTWYNTVLKMLTGEKQSKNIQDADIEKAKKLFKNLHPENIAGKLESNIKNFNNTLETAKKLQTQKKNEVDKNFTLLSSKILNELKNDNYEKALILVGQYEKAGTEYGKGASEEFNKKIQLYTYTLNVRKLFEKIKLLSKKSSTEIISLIPACVGIENNILKIISLNKEASKNLLLTKDENCKKIIDSNIQETDTNVLEINRALEKSMQWLSNEIAQNVEEDKFLCSFAVKIINTTEDGKELNVLDNIFKSTDKFESTDEVAKKNYTYLKNVINKSESYNKNKLEEIITYHMKKLQKAPIKEFETLTIQLLNTHHIQSIDSEKSDYKSFLQKQLCLLKELLSLNIN